MKPEKHCLDCESDISERGRLALRCVECAGERELALGRIRRRHLSAGLTWQRPLACLDCGVDISSRRGTAKRCVECAGKARRMQQQAWQKAYRRRRAAAKARAVASEPERTQPPVAALSTRYATLKRRRFLDLTGDEST